MKQIYDDELPSFMKSTKAFEALVSVAVEPAPDTKHPKRKSTTAEHSNGEVSVMISAGGTFSVSDFARFCRCCQFLLMIGDQ